ncbi:DUF2892 domain-containing protein [Arenibacter sp. M-2]|uniref:YgaP family membrane protein n=1 Tax=unclassified Arenibacter TaxID=2615047 RepID=UPI000D758ED4|nr:MULTISPECIES: DUF2892 domain-containing protein [unclassified Arenibacter]MDL5512378.1 DUF2892 domain-containing protein [Arenibacter sp. M-2]PXX26404.1 hypothetical protein C7972_10999 [Arenibacter sp. ARW7G5Y1]|tara:strand:+ start:13702 stop:13908 length:207 start_codon:yes stop_codon:yes gene_type:complete
MRKNMGNLDRTLRFVVAAALIALYYNDVISGTLGIVLVVLAIVFFLTSFIGFCPLYLPFGIRTCKAKK